MDWLIRLLGGHERMKDLGFCFTDVVNDKPVHAYRDTNGVEWLAHPGDRFFRVKRHTPPTTGSK